MGILEQEMKRLAQQAGGSYKTVDDRIRLAQRFCERLVLVQNVQIRRVEQLKARHIEGYIRERLAQSITKRSLQNEMAAVRCILKQAGRDRLAQSERLNNRSLGLSGTSRSGTKRAIAPEHYRQVLKTARIKDPGLAAALELSRLMGLRSQEAVQSAQSLKTWEQALERGESRLTVVFGTKGGRPRETMILDSIAVKKALDNVLAVAENRHGRLIDKPDLKSAMKYWHSQASCIGLTGAYSPHSLRYAWAQDAICYYLAQGFSEKEALAMTAMDLGHGDGRGRYVAQVYGRRDEED
ncbi:integrase domain-containing protein [Salmonella enterica]|uniref:DNA-binding protein n=1 Tax=Salmonella enterica subsp. VII serovar 40:z4,z24:[z39] TaxID=1967625 RepID=A0A731TDY3_SALEE|nr:DNA-binding protein [Salmonella enterica]EDO5296830.1 DNA-binding protein [Salmonella enterica subsp. houtenae serovar 40:z4,z24:-]EDS6440139.1 DNA-binding protein [Salmonella enterica subsp. VII str. CFSAN000550]EDU7900616.1 DNA-binding protein [Salmonella enterica subsp. houtenae]QJY65315.1 DNA-binding protein [Salmonella enterica subsp. VII serovar 1,40:g,z51:--]QUZ25048.1 integrase domain-containing protein [Salmonella enterica subsp. VII str. CFSAN000554]HAE4732742.1 DNA-binding prote